MTFYLSLTIIIVLIFLLYQVYNSAYSGDFSNSLWTESSLADKTVMIIVPHQDDEINLAGATIKNLTDKTTYMLLLFLLQQAIIMILVSTDFTKLWQLPKYWESQKKISSFLVIVICQWLMKHSIFITLMKILL